MQVEFSSINPYESIQAVVADSPSELCKALTAIQTPIRIVSIVAYGSKHAAYIQGDIRIEKLKPGRKPKENKG